SVSSPYPLRIKSVPAPYQVRTRSVSTPNKGTFIRTRYGVGTDQTRFRYISNIILEFIQQMCL
ncbi:hypothetical protein, partial [Bacteroides cellulosilyticus]|uniref:hypothetical protein n=1 Tax=Bacteroides cellulosilyticus TaxID=246787 RepID=UPI001E33CD77